MRERQMSRPGLLGALLGIVGLCLGDFVILRPNRLAAGEGLSLFEALPVWQWGLLLGVFCCLTGAALFPRRNVVAPAAVLAAFGALALLWAQGAVAGMLIEAGTAFTRVSLGSSLWIAVLGLFIVFTDLQHRSGRALLFRTAIAVAWGGALAGLVVSGALDELSLVQEFASRSMRFVTEFKAHLCIAGLSVAGATLLGIPLGVLLFKYKSLRLGAFSALNILQTIPSLALFGLLIAPLAFLAARFPLLREFQIGGIGWAPAVLALTLYSLLPVVRNTFTGFDTLDAGVLEAGRGMGMGRVAMFFRVQLPLAAPVILNGVRIASVQNIGNTAVAALIGAGGFGVFIFQGLGQAAADLVLLGAVPTILLAVFVDQLLQFLIHLFQAHRQQ